MGNPTASSISLHSFSLVIAALVLLSSFIHGDAAVNRNLMAAQTHDFYTVEVSSLLPGSVCDTSSQGYKLPSSSSLKVVHKHGPCNKHHKTDLPPSPSQILAHYDARVQSINARVVALNSAGNEFASTEAVTLPAKSGKSLGDNSYIVTVGLGSPKKDLTLAFDTGSSLTWTQCKPCVKCFKQHDPIFDPAQSTGYANVSCNTAKCNQLKPPRCSGTTCTYEQEYGDKSTSKGNMAKDTLTLSSTETITDFYFGCSHEAQGLFGQIAGVMGLGRDPFSLISQTSTKYGNIFSYCLPSTSSGSGYLTFGNAGISNAIQYTPLITSPTELYLINITGMYVGGKKLAVSPTVFSTRHYGAVIDSGASVTNLPLVAYTALRDTFRQQMAMYPMGKPYSKFDTCYDFSSYKGINVPKISIEFGGNKKIDLDITGALYVVSSSKMCLGFATSSGILGNLTILGIAQQKTLQVVYDVAGGRLGFGPNGCA